MPRKLLITVCFAIGLGAIHTGYWFFLQRQLAAGVAAWADHARQLGYSVKWERAGSGGWPTSAAMALRSVAVQGGQGTPFREIAWASPNVRLRIGLTSPYHLEVEPEGQQEIRIGRGSPVLVSAKSMLGTLVLGPDNAVTEIDAVATTLSTTFSGNASAPVTTGLLQSEVDLANPAGGIRFFLSGEAVDLPPQIKWPLGSRISSFSTEGKVTGKLSGGTSPAQWAGAWRDSGGAVELGKMALGWGPLGVSASATLALDDQLQPMGAGSARLVGYRPTLDAFADAGALSRSAVVAAKAILSLLAPTPGDGESGEVEVPLTLQYRTLSIRQVPLLRLPEVDWDQP